MLKGFFQGLKELKEMGDEFVEDIKGSFDELDQIIVDTVKEVSPEVGEFVEKSNKLGRTLINPTTALKDTLKVVNDDFSVGDHIKVGRGIYTHHGIYVGNDMVIHYADGYVHKATLDDFTQGLAITKVLSGKTYSVSEIIRRAESRLYESSYDLIFNNCEHFARWCRSGT